MRLPWKRSTENYQSTSYTDALVTALLSDKSEGQTAGAEP